MPGKNLRSDIIPATEWSSAIMPILIEGYTLKIPLEGRSMYPLLLGRRDEVIIAAVHGRKLKRGDIVLYVREDGIHVLHRIHHIKNKEYYMLGDAHTWIEGPLKEECILAVALTVVRKGKEISCNSYGYKLISNLWLLVRPIRPVLLILLRSLLKLKRSKSKV